MSPGPSWGPSRECALVLREIQKNLKSLFVSSENVMSKRIPGGPVAKTVSSQCRRPGFDPWSGN